MNLDKSRILCATHGAEFRIEDGYCVLGPCTGQSLEPVAVKLRDGNVVCD
jgi:nitrite reductase/ring-hydroxylating ferredoxin subunit